MSSRRKESSCRRRDDGALIDTVRLWEQYAHPRAREFFSSPELLEEVLMKLAEGIDKTDDPILGPEEKCVYWYGDVTRDELEAAIRMIKPGEGTGSVSYVNRVLVFIFAQDDSFEQLMELPKQALKMSCGDQLCVNLAHISFAVSDGNR